MGIFLHLNEVILTLMDRKFFSWTQIVGSDQDEYFLKLEEYQIDSACAVVKIDYVVSTILVFYNQWLQWNLYSNLLKSKPWLSKIMW